MTNRKHLLIAYYNYEDMIINNNYIVDKAYNYFIMIYVRETEMVAFVIISFLSHFVIKSRIFKLQSLNWTFHE